MSETIESLVSDISSLKGAVLFTMDDCLVYRSWQRQGADWDAELGAARFGDLLRATFAQLGQLAKGQLLSQVTVESDGALAVVRPLSDAVAAVFVFDRDTPLGLARFQIARIVAPLQGIVAAVGTVGAPVSRRHQTQVPPPAPPPSAPSRAPALPAPVGDSAPPERELGAGRPGELGPEAGARKGPSRTLTSEVGANLPVSSEPALTPPYPHGPLPVGVSVEAGQDPSPTDVDDEGSGAATRPRPPVFGSPRPPAPVITPAPVGSVRTPTPIAHDDHPPDTPAYPGEIEPLAREVPRGELLLSYLERHVDEAHTARSRVALQTGISLEALQSPESLTDGDLHEVEQAVRRILGLDRLEV